MDYVARSEYKSKESSDQNSLGNIEDGSFSQPVHAPLYGRPPYIYKDVEMFQILYVPAPEAAHSLLPHPLKLAPRCRASCVFAHYPIVSELGPYRECLVLLKANYRGQPVTYCPFVWVDTDEALCAGREIWGYPKKLAQIDFSVDEQLAQCHVVRNGKTLIEASVGLSEPGKLQYILFEDIVLQKIILSAEGGLSIRQLCRVRLRDYSFSSLLRGGPAVLNLLGSRHDPISCLAPTQIIGGVYGRGNMTLPFGTILE